MAARKKQTEEQVARFADMFSALGREPRLRLVRLLLPSSISALAAASTCCKLLCSALLRMTAEESFNERSQSTVPE